MFKFLRFPFAISIGFISSFSSLTFFQSAANAQNYPSCFLVMSPGQVKNVEELCQKQRNNLDKAKVCQGDFDSDGFLLSYYKELAQLESAIATVEKSNPNINYNLTQDKKVQLSIAKFMNQMPLSKRTQQLQQELKLLFMQAQETKNLNEILALQTKLDMIVTELSNDPCYMRTVQPLKDKFPQLLIF